MRRGLGGVPHPGHLPGRPVPPVQAALGTRSEGKAIVAVAHSMIVIVWHVLSADSATYDELGADYFEKRCDAEARKRYLVREPERLGHDVSLQSAA